MDDQQAAPPVRVGISGWNYDSFQGGFYPRKVPRTRWLEHYASVFSTVEANATFYRSQKPHTFASWRDRTPEGFVWAVKAHRYITHIKRLKDPAESLERFFAPLAELGGKLGPVLFQLPPNLKYDAGLLADFCSQLPACKSFALEARHDTWVCDQVFSLLQKHNVAWVAADTAGKFPFQVENTADFAYVRLHGAKELYYSEYSKKELAAWAARVRSWDRETFVYFDNTAQGHATQNARDFINLLA